MRHLIVGVAAVVGGWTAAEAGIISTTTGPIKVETIAAGLQSPWGMAFLPDGRLLVTEKAGRLRVVSPDGTISAPVANVPETVADGQGGFLDVVVDRQFATNGRIYMTFAEPGPGGAGVAVLSAQLNGNSLVDPRVIWRVTPKTGSGPQGVDGANHYGSRLMVTKLGYLMVTLGDRFLFSPAQDPATAIGKIVRITVTGTTPGTNPFVSQPGYRPEIWTLGHRNPQGIAIHPSTGEVWSTEHGPSGGDELNVLRAGANYGWPEVSWGDNYNGDDYPNHDTRPEFRAPVKWWTPRIAPSNIAFYTGTAIPAWAGNLLVGSLGESAIVRLTLTGRRVTGEERIPIGERVRDIEVDTQGRVFILTDSGNLKRLTRP